MVVMLTGHDHPSIEGKALELGAAAVVGKTVLMDDLLKRLDEVLVEAGRLLDLAVEEERQRHVALAAVGGDRDDPLALHLRPRRDVERGGDRGARRDADQEPFAGRNLVRHLERVLVRDRDRLVDHRAVEDVGDKAGADSLDLVRARLATAQGRPSRSARRRSIESLGGGPSRPGRHR